jgi:hypothetical protein
MPGYSVNWTHKTPNTLVQKTPCISGNITGRNTPEKIVPKGLLFINSPVENPEQLKHLNNFQYKNIAGNKAPAFATEPKSFTLSLKPPAKDSTHFFTGDEQEDDNARKSLIFGLLSIGFPIFGYLILFVIVISTGTLLANPVTYAIYIFLASCVTGMVFAILGLIKGFTALSEIYSSPDLYTGKGKATIGIILSAVLILSIAAYFLIHK